MDLIVLNRQEFISRLQAITARYGFVKEEDRFEKHFTLQAPGQQMMINGQIFEHPGRTLDVKLIVDLWGTGAIISGDSEIPFEQVCFMAYSKSKSQSEFDDVPDFEYCYGFQYDETTYFTKLLTKLFRL